MRDLDNLDSWQVIFEGDRAVAGNPSRENFLAPIIFPVPLLSPYVKTYVSVPGSTRAWYYGGRIVLNLGNVENPVPVYAASRKLVLDDWKLLNFNLLSPDNQGTQFHLVYEAPFYFPSVSLRVEQFNPPDVLPDP